MHLSDEDWKKKLTPDQYAVLREKATEMPFTGELLHTSEAGTYACAACGSVLFKSDAKYDSKIPGLEGWPSFSDVAKSDAVELRNDASFGIHRIEVVCKTCGGHLGHLFDDQSSPTTKHYCINSCALDFRSKKDAQ
jgi:peptide-methionine (R)-S-oxide reductase